MALQSPHEWQSLYKVYQSEHNSTILIKAHTHSPRYAVGWHISYFPGRKQMHFGRQGGASLSCIIIFVWRVAINVVCHRLGHLALLPNCHAHNNKLRHRTHGGWQLQSQIRRQNDHPPTKGTQCDSAPENERASQARQCHEAAQTVLRLHPKGGGGRHAPVRSPAIWAWMVEILRQGTSLPFTSV